MGRTDPPPIWVGITESVGRVYPPLGELELEISSTLPSPFCVTLLSLLFNCLLLLPQKALNLRPILKSISNWFSVNDSSMNLEISKDHLHRILVLFYYRQWVVFSFIFAMCPKSNGHISLYSIKQHVHLYHRNLFDCKRRILWIPFKF